MLGTLATKASTTPLHVTQPSPALRLGCPPTPLNLAQLSQPLTFLTVFGLFLAPNIWSPLAPMGALPLSLAQQGSCE